MRRCGDFDANGITVFDGVEDKGRLALEVWEDSFNSTYKATNVIPPKGAVCP